MKIDTVLITGATGSLGYTLIKKFLEMGVRRIRVFSRNESKIVEIMNKFDSEGIKYFIGDIRDKDRLIKACQNVDVIIHAAALKHVELIEYNPFEALKTNVIGTQNVIDAAIINNVKVVVGISTDKAIFPISTYGATKLLMEKMFLSAKNTKGEKPIKFKIVRLGNLFNSSGSVIEKFIQSITKENRINITDASMTRFHITLSDAADMIVNAIDSKIDLIVPKLPAYAVGDLAKALLTILNKRVEIKIIGMREGEKMHEDLGGYTSKEAHRLSQPELMGIIHKNCF